jgi:menaquinol-cytochrome c reductase iron-sulfur subunit
MSRKEDEVAAEQSEEVRSPKRRGFLAAISVAAGLVGAAIIASPVIGFVIGPALKRRPRVWRAVGALDSFPVGQTTLVRFRDAAALPWDGVSARTAAWLRRNADHEFVAFSVNCTHLGCPVRWEPEANLFMCPCHGGVYYSNGDVAGGPPPRSLHRYNVRVRNQEVEIEAGPIPVV